MVDRREGSTRLFPPCFRVGGAQAAINPSLALRLFIICLGAAQGGWAGNPGRDCATAATPVIAGTLASLLSTGSGFLLHQPAADGQGRGFLQGRSLRGGLGSDGDGKEENGGQEAEDSTVDAARRFMNAYKPEVYAKMRDDTTRTSAYRDAIMSLAPNRTVLDVKSPLPPFAFPPPRLPLLPAM